MFLKEHSLRVYYVLNFAAGLIISLLIFFVVSSKEKLDATASTMEKTYNCNVSLEKIDEFYLRLIDLSDIDEWNQLKLDILQIKENKGEEELQEEKILENESIIEDSDNLMQISVSAYHMGHTTASGKPVRVGMIAASYDLLREWEYGSTVILYTKDNTGNFKKYGEYVLEDKMHPRWKKTCDIYMSSDGKCYQFGRRKMWAINKKTTIN